MPFIQGEKICNRRKYADFIKKKSRVISVWLQFANAIKNNDSTWPLAFKHYLLNIYTDLYSPLIVINYIRKPKPAIININT